MIEVSVRRSKCVPQSDGRFQGHDIRKRTCVHGFAGFWEIRLDSVRVIAAA